MRATNNMKDIYSGSRSDGRRSGNEKDSVKAETVLLTIGDVGKTNLEDWKDLMTVKVNKEFRLCKHLLKTGKLPDILEPDAPLDHRNAVQMC
jgi:hypothetical protein